MSRTIMRQGVVAAVLTLVVVVVAFLTVRGAPLWEPDQRWSRALFDVGERNLWLQDAGNWFGAVTIPTVLRVITVVGAFLLWRRGEKASALWWALTMIVVGAVAIAARYAVGRPRPLWPGFGPPEEGLSYPSGHATSAVAFALCIVILAWRYDRLKIPVAIVAAVLAVGVSVSRVLVGVHRISDVVAAWALAGALVAASLAVAAWWERR